MNIIEWADDRHALKIGNRQLTIGNYSLWLSPIGCGHPLQALQVFGLNPGLFFSNLRS
jgi:hypothetical protein